jgi:hypothetical protein
LINSRQLFGILQIHTLNIDASVKLLVPARPSPVERIAIRRFDFHGVCAERYQARHREGTR